MSTLIGHSLGDNGEYEIISELGRGASSRIYRAWDHIGERDVAIKAIPNDADDPQGFARRFEREAQAIERMRHPNIVEVYGKGETAELVYLVMQYIAGGTLRARLGEPLPISEAVGAIIQMAHALHYAHQHGVIHRDVKPANMLVDAANPRRLLLADFGIAKLQGLHGLTKSGTTIGTPEYMAPEQAAGREVDHRADIYALGCVLYETLVGRPPFVGQTPISVLYQQVHTRPPYLRGLNTKAPRGLARVVQQALAKQPEERFDTALAMAQALYPFTESRFRDPEAPVAAWPALGSAGMETVPSSLQPTQSDHRWASEGLDALFPNDPEAQAAERGAPAQLFTQLPSSLLADVAIPAPEQPVLQPIQPDMNASSVAESNVQPAARRKWTMTPVLDLPLTPDGMLDIVALMAQAEHDHIAQSLPRLTPPRQRALFSEFSEVSSGVERDQALWPDSVETTGISNVLLERPPQRYSWETDAPTWDEHVYDKDTDAHPEGKKRIASPLRAAVAVTLAIAVITSCVVLLSQGSAGTHGNASHSVVRAPGAVATNTNGAATSTVSGTASATSAGAPIGAPSASPGASPTSTPLPPSLAIAPNPWSLRQNGLFSTQCSSGATSQTITNTGNHAVSWAWQSSGAPSPSTDSLQYSLNGGNSISGLPDHATLAAGSKDTLAVQMSCTARSYTVSVLATDLVTGASASSTFTLQVSAGGL